MSIYRRYAVAAVVLTGSVAAAAYAANHEEFYNGVTGGVSSLAGNMVLAGSMLSGDAHLENPAYDGMSTKQTDDRIESASVVTHVEVIGGGKKQRIVLLDPDGREVYSHDPMNNTTIIAKNAIIPSVTVRDSEDEIAELRVVTAAPAVEAPAELRQALAASDETPDLFYREDL